MAKARKVGGSSRSASIGAGPTAAGPAPGKRTQVAAKYGSPTAQPGSDAVSAAANAQAHGAGDAATMGALADVGRNLQQEGIEILKEAAGHPDADVKVTAMGMYVETWGKLQQLGAESDEYYDEAAALMQRLVQQLATRGNRRLQIEAAIICQQIGLDVPAAAEAAVQEESDALAARTPPSSGK